jgi:uncharacterized protein YqfA (UPF0365 family)
VTSPILAAQDIPTVVHVLMIALGLLFIVLPLVFIRTGYKWLKAMQTGDPDAMKNPVGRLLGKTRMGPLIEAVMRLRQAGIQIPDEALANHASAGGNIPRVVDWIVAVKSAELEVPFEQLCELDLEGKLPDLESTTGLDPAQLAAALHED